MKIAGHEITLYDDIMDMPVGRFQKFQKMLMVDAGVGSTVGDFDRHMERVYAYLRKGDVKNATNEIDVVRHGMKLIEEETDTRRLSFCCLIKEIDGKPVGKLTDDKLERLYGLMEEATVGEIEKSRSAAKKKIDEALSVYFPGEFEGSGEREFFDILKRGSMAKLDYIAGKGGMEEAERLEVEALLHARPFDLQSEVRCDRQFADLGFMISEKLGLDIEKMSVFTFYSALGYMKREALEKMKKLRNGR